MDASQLLNDVCAWAAARGIRVDRRRLRPDQAGKFDGVSATLNSDYAAEELAYYLAHALGSVVRWSLSRDAVQAMFDELRAAKKDRPDAARLERAVAAYRAFEVESSEYAVTLLAEAGHADAVPPYTNFMRADLEALTEFHRTGRAPVWRDFFARWKADVAAGRRAVAPFQARPVPPFTPARIEEQEILQRQGYKGRAGRNSLAPPAKAVIGSSPRPLSRGGFPCVPSPRSC